MNIEQFETLMVVAQQLREHSINLPTAYQVAIKEIAYTIEKTLS
jgi:hypothetical protein